MFSTALNGIRKKKQIDYLLENVILYKGYSYIYRW